MPLRQRCSKASRPSVFLTSYLVDLNFHPELVKPIQKCSTLEECLQQSLVINKLSNESMESLPHETAVQLIV